MRSINNSPDNNRTVSPPQSDSRDNVPLALSFSSQNEDSRDRNLCVVVHMTWVAVSIVSFFAKNMYKNKYYLKNYYNRISLIGCNKITPKITNYNLKNKIEAHNCLNLNAVSYILIVFKDIYSRLCNIPLKICSLILHSNNPMQLFLNF